MTVYSKKSVDELREFIYFGNIMNSNVQRDVENKSIYLYAYVKQFTDLLEKITCDNKIFETMQIIGIISCKTRH
jgi:hypothetical protein